MNGHLRYYLKEAASSFSRGGAMSLVAVLALTLAALSTGGWWLLSRNLRLWLDKAEGRFELVAYFKDGMEEAGAKALFEQLKALPEAGESVLLSPSDAAKELSKDAALAEYLGLLGGENPLPWSARIKAKSAAPGALKALAAKASALEGVSDLDWGAEGAEALLKWMRLLRSSLMFLGLALAFSAVLVTASVIRLTVHARREEISIMRMVGASHGFIRAPFLLEGFLQGLVGGSAGCLLLMGMGRFLAHKALSELQLDLGPYLPYGVDPLFFGAVALAAGLLGLLGSWMAVGGKIREGA
jgi:cell division transport system permease protein